MKRVVLMFIKKRKEERENDRKEENGYNNTRALVISF